MYRIFHRFFPFHLTLAVLLAALVYFLATRGMADPDIWWHLRNAQYLFANHQLPRFDSYSYTVLHSPWINHEWLAEIPYYLAWRAVGLRGLMLVSLALLETIFLGLFFFSYKTSGKLKESFVVSCLAILLSTVSFGPRTILFGWLYLLLLLVIVWRFRSGQRAPLWLLPPLFCLWANTHGSWLIGMIVFSIIIAGGLAERKWWHVEATPWSPSQVKKLFVAAGLSVVALFVNPYGYRLVLYPFDLAYRQKLNIQNVEEWASIDFHTPRGKLVLVFVLSLLLTALFSRKRWRLEELGLVLFAMYASLTYTRFLFLAAILVTPYLAGRLDFLPPYRPKDDKPLLNAIIVLMLLFAMLLRFPSATVVENDVATKYPFGAATYLNSHELNGRVFNYYLWGGYLGWHCRRVPTYIDSRVDIFEYKGVLKDYLDATSLKNSLDILNRYEIKYVLFPPSDALSYLLKNDPNWTVLYSDRISVIFERVGSRPEGEQQAAHVKASQ